MKEVLVHYATYNQWANKRMTDTIVNLSNEQLHKDINSSFRSVYKTLVHLWDAEYLWWQRLNLHQNVEWPGKSFNGSLMELTNNLLLQSKQWRDWTESNSGEELSKHFIYKNTRKEEFSQPVSEALIHLFNHQTYHRGQIITLLRQVGMKELPATSFIEYTRKK